MERAVTAVRSLIVIQIDLDIRTAFDLEVNVSKLLHLTKCISDT